MLDRPTLAKVIAPMPPQRYKGHTRTPTPTRKERRTGGVGVCMYVCVSVCACVCVCVGGGAMTTVPGPGNVVPEVCVVCGVGATTIEMGEELKLKQNHHHGVKKNMSDQVFMFGKMKRSPQVTDPILMTAHRQPPTHVPTSKQNSQATAHSTSPSIVQNSRPSSTSESMQTSLT